MLFFVKWYSNTIYMTACCVWQLEITHIATVALTPWPFAASSWDCPLLADVLHALLISPAFPVTLVSLPHSAHSHGQSSRFSSQPVCPPRPFSPFSTLLAICKCPLHSVFKSNSPSDQHFQQPSCHPNPLSHSPQMHLQLNPLLFL